MVRSSLKQRFSLDRRRVVAQVILEQPEPRQAALELARQEGIDFGVVWSWALAEARRNADAVIPATLSGRNLLDRQQWNSLKNRSIRDRTLVFVNCLHERLSNMIAEPDEIRVLLLRLMEDEDNGWVFSQLLFHPNAPIDLLFRFVEEGIFVSELAHRTGPVSLLERIAKVKRIEDAILTLLLSYYATDDYSDSQFVQFVRDYGDVHGVRYELQNKTNIPEHKRRLGQRVLAEMPK